MTVKKTTAKKAVKKKAVAKKKAPAKKKVAVKKKTAAKKTATKKRAKKVVSAEQRYKMIQDAAYYLAEKAGFSGNTVDHWTQAEKQISAKLKAK